MCFDRPTPRGPGANQGNRVTLEAKWIASKLALFHMDVSQMVPDHYRLRRYRRRPPVVFHAPGWFHVWQNNTLTFIAASLNRGYKTIETYFKDGFVKAVVTIQV